MSRLSELSAAREFGRFNKTDSDNARDRDATFGRWFRCLTGPLTYLYDATVPSFFFYAHAKWKARIYCDSWIGSVSKEAKRGSHKPYMWLTGINPGKSHGQGP